MSKHLLIFFFTLSTNLALAQKYTIKGSVVNKDEKPLEFMSIMLLKNDTLLTTQTTTPKGEFSFEVEKGNYSLIIKKFGTEFFKNSFFLSETKYFGKITIDEFFMLEGVTIEHRAKIITHVGDKLIFNVENSPISKGNNGLEILQRSPKLSLGAQGNVLLQNKDAIILINGKASNLNGSDLSNYLASINSEDIKRVEIQDLSSSNQDASSNGGTINVVLKRQPKGFRAIAKSYYLYRGHNYDASNSSLNLNYGASSWNIYSNVNYTTNRDKGHSKGFFDYDNGQSILNKGDFKQNSNFSGIRVGAVVTPDVKNEFGVEAYLNKSPGTTYYQNSLEILENGNKPVNGNTTSTSWTKNRLWYLTSNYTYKIDSLGSSLKLFGDLGQNNSQPANDVVSLYVHDPNSNNHYSNETNSRSKYFSLQADFSKQTRSGWEFMSGLKYNRINRDNQQFTKLLKNNNTTEENIQNLDFNNSENIYAGYLLASKNWGKHFLKAGARFEGTAVKGLNTLNNQTVNQSYSRIFPTIYYKYSFDDDKALSFAYKSGIGRPSFYDLNPYVIKQNDYLYQIGNPALLPQYNDNFYVDYSFKKNTISGYIELTDRMIHSVYYVKDGITYYQALNYGNAQGMGINHSYSDNLVKWLYLSINSGFFYNRFKPDNISSIEGLAFYNNLQTRIKFNKYWMAEVFSNYTTASKYRNVDMAYVYKMDIGVQRTLFNGKLISKLRVNDLFNTQRDKNLSHYEMFTYDFYQKRNTRSIVFHLQFTLDNNKKLREANVKSDNEIRNRL